MFVAVFVSVGSRAEAAPENVVSTSASPSTFRQLCNAGTPVDFAVSPSNVGFNITTGVLSYNINLQWKRCTAENTRAYAIYSNGSEICPYSGTYGVGGWTTDCVKYIGSPAYVGPGNGLACWGGTNNQCITPVFSGVRRVENQPSYGINTASIPMSASNSLWSVAPDNGTWTVTQRMCQYYKTGANFGINNDNRCVDVSISVTWSGSTQYAFNITTNGIATLNDDENPTSVKFDNVGAKSDFTVNNIKLTRKYLIKRGGSPDIDILPAANPSTQIVNIGTSLYSIPPNPDTRALSGLVVGDQVCVVVTASPGSGKVKSDGTVTVAGNDKQESYCDRFVNRPFVSFYGGDVSAGAAYGPVAGPFTCNTARGIATFNRSSGGYLGSGVEFAAQAAGNISGFSSSRGVGANPKRLSFTNTDGNATFGGGFGCARSIPNYFSATAGQSFQNRPVLNLASITASGNYFFTNPAGVRVWGTLPQGVRANIYIRGNVFVEDNITYATGPGGNWGAITDIPALRLYTEGDIHINRTVTTMYGFYFAQPVNAATGGQIYTCSSAPGAQVSVANMFADCNTKLTVRGGFTAKKVNLLRSRLSLRNGTAATESTSTGSSAAEVFVYAPEAFLVGPESITTNGGSDDPEIQYIMARPPVL